MEGLSAVGIDLGTTFSAVGVVNKYGQPEIVPNAEGERITPSAVFFDEDAIVVGQVARDRALTNPDQVAMFVKPQMGNPSWYFTYRGQRHSPADVSAIILAKLKRDSERVLARPVTHAVITVPAYFDDVRRRATITAGEIAGFNVLELVNEPTAAAIAFGADHGDRNEIVLVYDLGGGTFDVTLMSIEGKEIRIIATDGNHELGGKDFDDAIMRFVVDRFREQYGTDPTLEDTFVSQELRLNAEKAKKELSKRTKTMVMLRADERATRVEITREVFESLIRPKLDTTLTIVRSVLREAKLKADGVDRVLLTGGSTRIPAVRSLLAEFFGREPDTSINPDEAIALGAALMAAKRISELSPSEVIPAIAEKVGGLQITDVTSHSFGIEASIPGTQQKINSVLIPRNTPIPTETSKEFVTTVPGQTAIQVKIFQGEFQDPSLCNPIGDFVLTGLPPNRPAGRKVRVTFSCSANGVINVTAVDIETGLQTTTEITYRVGNSPRQVSEKKGWLQGIPIE